MAGLNIRVVADGVMDDSGHIGGFNVEFMNQDGTQAFVSVSGFPTATAAQEWVRDYLVKMMAASIRVN